MKLAAIFILFSTHSVLLATSASKLQVLGAASDWAASRPLPVTIKADGVDAPKVGIAGSFAETSTRIPLAGAIELCASEKEPCDRNISIPSGATRVAYLHYSRHDEPGVFGGTFVLISEGISSSEKQALTVYVSSWSDRLQGVIVVLAGALLAWLVKVYVSNRVTRDQALLPVAADLERLASIDAVLKQAKAATGGSTPKLTAAVQQWESDLTPAMLEASHGLSAGVPSPFSAFARTGGDFLAFLAKADAAITLLTVFSTQGVRQVLNEVDAGTLPANSAAAIIVKIDQMYSPDLSPAMAAQQITAAIEAGRPRTMAETNAIGGDKAVPAPLLSVNSLLMEIRTLNSTAWIVLLLAGVLGTITVLVLKPGFGKLADYLLCFTASFGVPVVGGAMLPGQSTTSVVTSTPQTASGSRGLAGV